jgi:hypothetical protein
MYFKPNFAILPFPAQNNYKAITLVPDGRRHLPLVKDSGGPELGDEGDGAPQSRGEFKVGSFSNHEKAPSNHARRLHSTLAIKLERFRKFSTKKFSQFLNVSCYLLLQTVCNTQSKALAWQ